MKINVLHWVHCCSCYVAWGLLTHSKLLVECTVVKVTLTRSDPKPGRNLRGCTASPFCLERDLLNEAFCAWVTTMM